MFDITDSLEDMVVSAKKLCNKIEMCVDGCEDILRLRKIFHIHRHLRDVLRELESGKLNIYETQRAVIEGLTQAFERELNVRHLA